MVDKMDLEQAYQPLEHVLVVVDPMQDTQPALDRAIKTAKIAERTPFLHILVCVNASNANTDAENWQLYRDISWLDELMASVKNADIQYTATISWSHQWQENLLYTADYHNCGMICLSDYSGDGSAFTNEGWSIWGLLRNASCPVLIVRDYEDAKRTAVLGAINIQNTRPVYQELSDKVLAVTDWIAQGYGAEMHVVNAYDDSLNFPDRSALLSKTGLDNDHVHIRQGEPEDVIYEVAKKIDADIVVIGSRSRKGIKAMMKGNTSEKVLAKIKQDVIVLN